MLAAYCATTLLAQPNDVGFRIERIKDGISIAKVNLRL